MSVNKVITPVFKKGKKDEISNYRPVANLCGCSKIYERIIVFNVYLISERIESYAKSGRDF